MKFLLLSLLSIPLFQSCSSCDKEIDGRCFRKTTEYKCTKYDPNGQTVCLDESYIAPADPEEYKTYCVDERCASSGSVATVRKRTVCRPEPVCLKMEYVDVWKEVK
jgi:hypothetical protein